MRVLFSHLQDTVAGTVGYVWRIVAGANRVKDAVFFSMPGYYARPNDEDDTTGREDCLHVESGSERVVFATRNATGLLRLLSYLARALDKGERVITAEDGTARATIHARPNGDVIIKADNGLTAPNDKTMTATWDASTGDLILDCGGTTPGNVMAGTGANSKVARYTELKALYDTLVTGIEARFNNHGHQYLPGPGPVAFTQGPGAAIGPSAPPTNFPPWDTNIASSTLDSD